MSFPWYEVGTTVEMLVEFNDLSGDRSDPETIAFKLTEPDGTVTNKNKGELTQESTGIWYYPHTTDQLGLHSFTFTGVSGVTTVVKSGYFNVRQLNP